MRNGKRKSSRMSKLARGMFPFKKLRYVYPGQTARQFGKGYVKLRGGYHPPGYNYLGPGTRSMSRIPRNRLDRAARSHDIAYGRMGAGKSWKPYTHYSRADARFLRNSRGIRGPAAYASRGFFKLKRRFAPRYKYRTKTLRSRPRK